MLRLRCPSPEPWSPSIRHFGFWSLNGARVGEELFEVFVDPPSEIVMYRLRAVSRPRAALTYLGYPLVRVLQAACRRDSGNAMKLALRAREVRP